MQRNSPSSMLGGFNAKTRTKANGSFDSPQTKRGPPVKGLTNIGNTCFLNASIQALACMPAFHSYLYTHVKLSNGSVTKSMFRTIMDTSIQNGKNFETPQITRNPKIKEKFIKGQQQDSHEFIRYVLGIIEEESEKVPLLSSKANEEKSLKTRGMGKNTQCNLSFSSLLLPTIKATIQTSLDLPLILTPKLKIGFIKNPFCGLLESKIECTNCGFTSVNLSKFLDLSLPLMVDKRSGTRIRLEELLKEYSKEELVNDVRCVKCSKQQNSKEASSTCKKSLTISRSPLLLCLHLNKLNWTNTQDLNKISHRVEYKSKLDLLPYTTCSSSTDSLEYRLAAIIVHQGNSRGGHYTCFRRLLTNGGIFNEKLYSKFVNDFIDSGHTMCKTKDVWLHISDKNVEFVPSEEAVLSSADPYILFYERITKHPPL